MSLNAAVPNRIQPLLQGSNQTVIFNKLLTALTSGIIMPQEIYLSASIISVEVLHKLALEFQNASGFEYRKYAYSFFLAAGKKGHNFSFAQCAIIHLNRSEEYGVEYSPSKAQELMTQAFNLCTESEKSFFNLPLAYVLKANGQPLEANRAILNYFHFCLHRDAQAVNITDVQNGIDFCMEVLQEINHELFGDGKAQPPAKESVEKRLSQLAILSDSVLFKKIPPNVAKQMDALRQNILKTEGACYGLLDMPDEVFIRHCAFDKTFSEYQTSLITRASILKKTVAELLTPTTVPGITSAVPLITSVTIPTPPPIAAVSRTAATDGTSSASALIRKQARFNRFWQRASIHFDVVNETDLEQEYQKRFVQMETLIKAKETENEALEEAIDIAEKTQDAALLSLQVQSKKVKQKSETLKKAQNDFKEVDYYQHNAKYRQEYRRAQAEHCFFNPKRSTKKNQVVALAREIIDRRYQQKNDALPLTVSVRMFAMAEKAFQDAVLTLTGDTSPQLGIPAANKKNSVTYGPVESYKIGATTAQFIHRTHPDPKRLGDSYSSDHPYGTYDASIYKFLSRITNNNPEKEKQIAQLFIVYGRTQQSVKLGTLQNIYKPATSHDVAEFNRICLLILSKEQTQWLSATSLPYQGLAVAQARCLILMSKGFIRFSEVFQNDVKYGVYSKRGLLDNPHKLSQVCQDIDELFMRYLQTEYPAEHEIVSKQIAASGKKCAIVSTRKVARENLKTVYGGDSDSGNEADYNSDVQCEGSFLNCKP